MRLADTNWHTDQLKRNCPCKQNVLNTRSMTYWCMEAQGNNSPVLEALSGVQAV